MISETTLLEYLKEGKTVWQIMEDEKVCRNTVTKYLKKYNIETPKGFYSRGRRIGRPPGFKHTDKFKSMMSVRMSGESNPFYNKKHTESTKLKMKNNHADFSGYNNPFKAWINSSKNRDMFSSIVRKSWKTRNKSKSRKLSSGYRNIPKWFWSRIRGNAKTRGLEFQLTIEDGWSILIAQGCRCAYTNVPLILGRASDLDITASLDRIDPTKGYTLSNVEWVHKYINIMKNQATKDNFVSWCVAVARHNYEKSNG